MTRQRQCRICHKRLPWRGKNCPPGICKKCHHATIWVDRPAARRERREAERAASADSLADFAGPLVYDGYLESRDRSKATPTQASCAAPKAVCRDRPGRPRARLPVDSRCPAQPGGFHRQHSAPAGHLDQWRGHARGWGARCSPRSRSLSPRTLRPARSASCS